MSTIIKSLNNNESGSTFRNNLNSNFDSLRLNKSEIDHTHTDVYAPISTEEALSSLSDTVDANSQDISTLTSRVVALEEALSSLSNNGN